MLALECSAVVVEWRPVHHGVAGSAVPGGVSAAAVTEAGDVTDEDYRIQIFRDVRGVTITAQRHPTQLQWSLPVTRLGRTRGGQIHIED